MSSSQPEQNISKYFRLVIMLTAFLAICLSVFHFATSAVGSLPTMQQRSVHLGLVLALIFLESITKRREASKLINSIDLIFAITSLVVCFYALVNWYDMLMRVAFPATLDIVIGTLLIILVLEATRRKLGMAIPIIAILFIFYAIWGHLIPIHAIAHRQYPYWRLISYLTMATEGIYGKVLGVSATYIFLFVLFGAFLEKTGASRFFIDLSLALFGTSKGGPAKVGTVASGLFGMVSGSAVANVMAVGPFTIPMMTRLGYPAKFSGGITSVAGTGGQFMPPIMGAAAFIIAETLSIPYMSVVKAAFIPAVLYYAALWFIIDIRATRDNIKTLASDEVPDWKVILVKGFYLAIPLILLVYFLAIARWSPIKSGFWSIVSLMFVSSLKKETRMDWKTFLKAFEAGALSALSVAIICATAGIIIGVLSLTGLSLKFSNLLITISFGIKPLLLILTMIAGLILGMGMTTTSVYIVLSVLVAPALVKMNVQPIAAHLFVFYFGILSAITPPVATASYAAASITKSSPTALGFEGWRIGLTGYIIPFMFIYNPALLFEGSPFVLIQSIVTAFLGIYFLAVAIEGYCMVEVNWLLRGAFGLAALLLISGGFVTDIIGVVIGFTIWGYLKVLSRKRGSKPILSEVIEERELS